MKRYKLLKDLPFSEKGKIYDGEGVDENGDDNYLVKEWLMENSYFDKLLGVWLEEVEEEALVKYGFNIICESPFEISDGEGNTATGECARIIKRHFEEKEKKFGL